MKKLHGNTYACLVHHDVQLQHCDMLSKSSKVKYDLSIDLKMSLTAETKTGKSSMPLSDFAHFSCLSAVYTV